MASFLGDANLLDAEAVTVNGGTITAALPDGTRVQGSGTAGCAAGRPVQVFVRPEDVVVRANGATGSPVNSVRGRVEATVIVGGLDRKVLVRLGNDMIVESLVRAGADDIATGTPVHASWPVEKTIVYGQAS